MKILNLVKERVKSDSQGLGLQDEGKKKEKPEEVMNQGSGTRCQPKDKGKCRCSLHCWVLLWREGGNGEQGEKLGGNCRDGRDEGEAR